MATITINTLSMFLLLLSWLLLMLLIHTRTQHLFRVFFLLCEDWLLECVIFCEGQKECGQTMTLGHILCLCEVEII